MDAMKTYIQEARRLSKAAQADPNVTPENLILRNLALPVSMARAVLRKTHLPSPKQAMEELVAAANLALVRAAHAFNIQEAKMEPGAFTPYAMATIERELWALVHDMRTGGAGSSHHAQRNIYAVRAELARLRRDGEQVDPDEIGRELGLLPETVRGLIALADGVLSLDVPKIDADGDESLTYGEALAAEDPGPEAEALASVEAEEREELRRAVATLPNHYRAAVAFVTGFRAFQHVTVADVLRASGKSAQYTARGRLVKVFQRGQASAERIGYRLEDATGQRVGQGTAKGLAGTGKSSKQGRDNPADIWQRLTDRWRQAAEMDTGQCVGG